MSETIQVQDPSGGLVSVSKKDAADLFQMGYAPLSADRQAQINKENEFGSTGQQVITGLENAGSAATFGLSTGVETALGVNPEDIQARNEVNPGARIVGQIGGLAASALIPGYGAASLLGKAGQGAAAIAGLGAAEGIGARVGAAALKGAVETALFQSGDEVSKMMMSDPDQTVGSAAANVGLSGLIGAGLGGAMGAAGSLWNAKFGPKTSGILQDVKNEAMGSTTLQQEAAPNYLAEDQEAAIKSRILDIKPNADEIHQAAQNLGIKPTVGTLSNSKLVQNMEDVLERRPTFGGAMASSEKQAILDKVVNGVKSTLSDATPLTDVQVNEELEKGIVGKLQDELTPLQESYKKLRPEMEKMEVNPRSAKGVANAVRQLGKGGLEEVRRAAEDVADQIEGLKNVNSITQLRTQINRKIGQLVKTGGPDFEVYTKSKEFLTSLRENAIDRATEATGIGKQASNISSDIIQELKDTDTKYGAWKTKARATGQALKVGKAESTNALMEKLGKVNDGALSKKVFNTNDFSAMQFMKENFKDEYELARKALLRQIRQASESEAMGKNGQLNLSTYYNKLADDSVGPEARGELLGKKHQTFLDTRTIYRAIPGMANPSGTSMAEAFGNLGSIKGWLDNASDAVKYAILKGIKPAMGVVESTDGKAAGLGLMKTLHSGAEVSASGFKSMVDYLGQVIKGENALGRAANAVFDSSRIVIPTKFLPSDKDHEKLDKKLQSLENNPSPLLDSGSETAHYMPEHGMAIAKTTSQAVNYLNMIRPSDHKPGPLDEIIHPSAAQKQAYNEALTIAEKPLSILNHVKDGTVTSAHMQHIQSMYPALVDRMKQKLTSEMIHHLSNENTIPYQTRMGLSMFLGQPLDSTMTPQSIQNIQNVPAIAKTQQPLQPQQHGPHSMKNITKLAQSSYTPGQARAQARQSVKP